MKVAIYSRVSTAGQDAQGPLAELRRAVRRRGWRVVAEVAEIGSGASSDRKKWAELLRRAAQYDVIAVWALDRAGRSTLDLLTQVQVLRAKGCGLWAVSQGLEVMPAGKGAATSDLVLQVLAAVAEFERSIIRGRTLAGLERARARGKTLGRPRLKTRPSKRAVEALRQKGNSWSAIADQLRCSVWAARSA